MPNNKRIISMSMTHQKRWDEQEDLAFLEALHLYGYGCWTQIARHLQLQTDVKRTPLQVKNRARHLILYDTASQLGAELKRLSTEHPSNITTTPPSLHNHHNSYSRHANKEISTLDTDSQPTPSSTPVSIASTETIESTESVDSTGMMDIYSSPGTPNSIVHNYNNNICAERPLSPLLTPKQILDASEALYQSDFISERERQALPEFFTGQSTTRTPDRFLKIRQTILHLWLQCRPQSVTKLASRVALRGIAGDVSLISKVHAYLEAHELINNFPMPHRHHRHLEHRVKRTVTPTSSTSSNGVAEYRRRPRTRALGLDPFELMTLTPHPDDLSLHFNPIVFVLATVHSFLSKQEVIGVLGGNFDPRSKAFMVTAVFPCQSALASGLECELDAFAELKACEHFANQGCVMIGWYHSHPTFPARPSRRDLETQAMYQRLFPGHPPAFVGVIISPFPLSTMTKEGVEVGCFMASEVIHPKGSNGNNNNNNNNNGYNNTKSTITGDKLEFCLIAHKQKENSPIEQHQCEILRGRLLELLAMVCKPSTQPSDLIKADQVERMSRFLDSQLQAESESNSTLHSHHHHPLVEVVRKLLLSPTTSPTLA